MDYNIKLTAILFENDDFTSSVFDEYIIDNSIIKTYKISKDTINRNFCIHQLIINDGIFNFQADLITDKKLLVFKMRHKKIKLKISVFDTKNIIIKENSFIIISVEEFLNDNVNHIKLNMISDIVYDELNNCDISTNILKKNDGVTQMGNAQLMLEYICNEYNIKYTNDINIFINNYCKNTFNYPSIRIPNNINNIEIFDHFLQNYNPYILKPYIIIDDFYFDKNIKNTKYNLIVENLCMLKDNFPMSANNIRSTLKFVQSSPIFDEQEFKEDIKSILIIENKSYDVTMELRPKELKSNRIKTKSINEDLDFVIKNMEMKKKMLDDISMYNTYTFDNLNLEDITFNKVYDITAIDKYNDLPVVIDYVFDNTSGKFNLSGTVTFVNVPNDLNSSR